MNLQQFVENLIGVYQYNPPVDGGVGAFYASIDYGYITRALLLIICVYYFFRLLITFLSGLMR